MAHKAATYSGFIECFPELLDQQHLVVQLDYILCTNSDMSHTSPPARQSCLIHTET